MVSQPTRIQFRFYQNDYESWMGNDAGGAVAFGRFCVRLVTRNTKHYLSRRLSLKVSQINCKPHECKHTVDTPVLPSFRTNEQCSASLSVGNGLLAMLEI
jgi:hypothetical protein